MKDNQKQLLESEEKTGRNLDVLSVDIVGITVSNRWSIVYRVIMTMIILWSSSWQDKQIYEVIG